MCVRKRVKKRFETREYTLNQGCRCRSGRDAGEHACFLGFVPRVQTFRLLFPLAVLNKALPPSTGHEKQLQPQHKINENLSQRVLPVLYLRVQDKTAAHIPIIFYVLETFTLTWLWQLHNNHLLESGLNIDLLMTQMNRHNTSYSSDYNTNPRHVRTSKPLKTEFHKMFSPTRTKKICIYIQIFLLLFHIVVQTQYNILFKLHNHIQIRGRVTQLRPLEVYNSIAVQIKYFKYNS